MRKWILIGVIAILMFPSVGGVPPVLSSSLPPLRRVNAPYFSGQIDFSQTAIFWFGQVTSADAYSDVRVGYSDSKLYIHLNIMDRSLWYDTAPTADTLDQWDAVTIYLNTDGNTGSTLGSNAYRFTAQLVGGYQDNRSRWTAAWRSSGSGWVPIAVPYTPELGSNGTINNDSDADRGWVIDFHIPFSNLGLSAPPPHGTIWGLAIATHNRDSLAGPVVTSAWPDGVDFSVPHTWGQLRFGIPSFTPSLDVLQKSTTTIRQGLNGAVVPDVSAGGGFNCGADLDYYTQWGAKNYAGEPNFNVQNQGDISDWPCFSKYFVTFPLSAVPGNKVIVSATLTLYQFGNTGVGWNPGPVPSYLQALTVDQEWTESTLTWNNAPLVRENITGTWVIPIDPNNPPPYPGGIAYRWDVSRAVTEAYTAGQPLRLAVYSADGPIQSGRYFYSSGVENYNAQGRPTLQITWGQAGPTLGYSASPPNPLNGQRVTYTLSSIGSGNALTLTSLLPTQVSSPGSIVVTGGGTAAYNAGSRQVVWSGAPATGTPVTVTFPVTVVAASPMLLRSTATLIDALGGTAQATADVIANAYQVNLPLIRRQ
jgi:hypothetical protein